MNTEGPRLFTDVGITTLSRALSANACFSMDSNDVGRTTANNLEQSKKALYAMRVTVVGMSMLLSSDDEKVVALISTTDVGRIMFVTLHLENAPVSMKVIEVGMKTTSRLDANKNIWYEIAISDVGRVIEVNEEHPAKAKSPTAITEVGIFTFKRFVEFKNKLTGK